MKYSSKGEAERQKILKKKYIKLNKVLAGGQETEDVAREAARARGRGRRAMAAMTGDMQQLATAAAAGSGPRTKTTFLAPVILWGNLMSGGSELTSRHAH